MIKPRELESDSGSSIWATITAAETGDTETLQALLQRDPGLSRADYFYTHPIHFAVRSGHVESVQLLLDAGVDPEWNGFHHGSLIEMAHDRGHEAIAQILEQARDRHGRVAPGLDHPIHQAAKSDDVQRVRELRDADWSLIDRGDKLGGTPLHRAVMCSARRVVAVLLDRGANSMRSTVPAADREADGVHTTCNPSTSRSSETILPLRPKAISRQRAYSLNAEPPAT